MGFFIVAAIFLSIGTSLAYRAWRRSKTWQPAKAQGDAKKTYIRRGLNGGRTLLDQVRYQFEDGRGMKHSFDIHDYSGLRDSEMQLSIFYDPQNPRRVLINTTRDMYGWAAGLILFGIWLIVFGCISIK
jgi:hypothetical protein